MVRHSPDRVLLIGDAHHQVESVLARALPHSQITSVTTIFDGINELSTGDFVAVLAAAEPIERRPEAAVRVLRKMSGNGRLFLFGDPTHELLSRKMLKCGCDDYVVSPPSVADIEQLFRTGHVTPPVHVPQSIAAAEARATRNEPDIAPTPVVTHLADLPLADIFVDAMVSQPNATSIAALKMINSRIDPAQEFRYVPKTDPPPDGLPTGAIFTVPIKTAVDDFGTLYFFSADPDDNHSAVRQIVLQVASLVAKSAVIQDRHNRLQKLAVNDDLTGIYNARYFRHFLTKILERAKAARFPVTLLLFDIDDFKKYNDQYGHGVGDEILKQTAQLMRRCCREHDLVARIGGDEFAVVFWDKEGPRHPLDPSKKSAPSLPPQTPVQIFERFRRLAASSDFSGLGEKGQGRLSVSGGLAVYPYDAQDVNGLIKAADDFLMFKAKKAGKNSVYLVEGREREA